MRGKRRSREEWLEVIREFEASGQTVAAFAQQLEVQPATLAWWRAALKREGRGKTSAYGQAQVELALEESATPDAKVIEVRIGELVVRFPADIDPERLGAIFLELKSIC